MVSRSARFAPLVAVGVVAACSSVTPDPAPNERSAETQASLASLPSAASPSSPRRLPRGAMAMRPEGVRPAPSQPARVTAPSQQLIYFGGHVISNVKIVAVNWGPKVDATFTSQIAGFYTAITNSVYFDWLSEYDTIGVRAVDGSFGTNQRIGRGSFVGSYTITPSLTTSTVSDTEIETELVGQLAAGKLPPPEIDASGGVSSLYMFDFPPGVTIKLWNAGGTATSCSKPGFGAYHSAVRIGDKVVPYGVHPSCGFSFGSETSIHAHELIEAVTDPEIGLVDPDLKPGETRPSAWYSFINGQDSGEIADLCATTGGDVTIAGYNVTTVWSNTQGSCVGSAATIICDGSAPAIAGCRACTAADDGVACNGARPHCEVDPNSFKHGQCVPCTTGTQCPTAYPTCVKANDATDDTCVSTATCASNNDCAAGTPICDATTHHCRACADGDCSGATPACEHLAGNVHTGRCVACTASKTTACTGATPTCDAFTNKCVGCMANTDCTTAAPTCLIPAHTCGPCTTSNDCFANGGVCATSAGDPRKGHCVQCVAASDCASPATCNTATDVCTGGTVFADAGPPGSDAGGADASSAGDGSAAGADGGSGSSGGSGGGGGSGSGSGSGGGANDASTGSGGTGSTGGCAASPRRASSGSLGVIGVIGLAMLAARRRSRRRDAR